MHIGLIGGIGVAATVVYYQRLTARVTQLGHVLDLTIVHADVQELLHNNLDWKPEAQAKSYARLIGRLKDAGADCAVITSLGGHFCYDETQSISPLPLVSGIAPLDAYFVEQGINRVGLLGTANLMRSRLFDQLKQTEAVVPNTDLDALGKTYQDVAVSGACNPEQREVFFAAGREMVERQGAEVVILAGTDLNLAFDGHDPGYRVIDALDVHVALLADLATGARSLADLEGTA